MYCTLLWLTKLQTQHFVKESPVPMLGKLHVMSNVAISLTICLLNGTCCLFMHLCAQKLVPTCASFVYTITRSFETVTKRAYCIVGKNLRQKKNVNCHQKRRKKFLQRTLPNSGHNLSITVVFQFLYNSIFLL